jgi:hypothetical protein
MIALEVPATCPSGGMELFPPRTFASADYDGAGLRKQMSGFFVLMSEPSLWCGDGPDEVYRLLNYFPFWPPQHPTAIRIARVGATSHLRAVSLAGGKGVTLSVDRRTEKPLTDQEWAAFATAVQAADFWMAPNELPKAGAVLDGDTWVLEGRRGHSYRVLPFTPVDRPLFLTMLRAFFGMAGLDVPSDLSK